MQATQSIPVLHISSGSQPEQMIPVDGVEFTAQLTESMQKNGQQVPNQVESESVQLLEVSENEMEQDTEQPDSLKEQIDPNVAAFFYQPLKMAEQQLTTHLEPASKSPDTDSVAHVQQIRPVSVQEVTFSHSQEAVLNNTRVTLEVAQPTELKEAHLPAQPTVVASLIGKIEQTTILSQNSEAVFKTQAQTVEKDTVERLQMNTESNIIEPVLMKKLENSPSFAMNNGLGNAEVPEFEQAIEQLGIEQSAEKMTGQDDLDIQSQLRMKVSGSFTDQLAAVPAQTTISQKETAVPVLLTSESSSKNQQVLTQAVSEVIFDQSAGMKEGQHSTARLSLTPESLGNMKIEIQIREQQLYTTIVVESTETKELMDNSMKQLTASLAQKNIQLQEMTVQINLPQATDFSFAESSQHEAGSQNNTAPVGFTESTDTPDSTVVEEETDASTGRLSILA